MNRKLIVFDTTLRDGEQCPGASMNLKEKLQVAHKLARLGNDIIEAGFPVIGDGDFQAVKQIAEEVKGPIIAALARCVDKDIDAAGEALKPAGKKGRIHVFLATSKIHLEYKLNKAQEQILKLTEWGVRRARGFVEDVEFSPEDASRTEPGFLVKVCRTAIDAGATTINIPDTVGWAVPEQFGALVRYLIQEVPEFSDGRAVLSVHCHNDLGMAVANTLAAVQAGARQVEVTVNGIGERAGNAASEEVVMALKTRGDYYGGVSCGIDTTQYVETSQLVARMCGLAVQRSKAIVGANAFAHGSGIHQHGILRKRETYEIMDPRSVGWDESNLILTKHSGKAAVAARLKKLGFKLTPEDVDAIAEQVKSLGDKVKYVRDDDLASFAEVRLALVPEVWTLVQVLSVGGNASKPVSTVKLKKNQVGQIQEIEATSDGDGPIDAAFKAIAKITGLKVRIDKFSLKGSSSGRDALGGVFLKASFGTATIVSGKATDTDSVVASTLALLNAINRYLANGDAL